MMKQRSLFLRRAAFAVLIILAAVCQFAFGKFLVAFGAAPMLLLPLVVSIAMHENMVCAVLFGAFAGIIADMFSISTDGFFSVCFALAAFSSAAMTTFLLRRVFVSALIYSAFWAFLINIAYWIFFVVIKKYDFVFSLLLSKYIPSAIYTALIILIMYPIVKKLCSIGNGGLSDEV